MSTKPFKKLYFFTILSALIFLFSCSENSTDPEQDEGQWTTYTTSDGLPSDAVGAIAFGPDGELWCVPLAEGGLGVAYFDGNSWKQYTANDGLGSNAILWMENTLAVSSNGDLWVGTFGGGVSYFDGERWTTYTTDDGLLANQVTAVAIAPNGDLWCAHAQPDCGLSRFNGVSWTVYTANNIGLSFCNLLTLAFDPSGILWAGGGVVIRFGGQNWISFSSETGMQQPIALYMDIGPDGKIWIAGNGVSCYNGTIWTYYSFDAIGVGSEHGEVIPIAVDSDNVVWIGIAGEGVFRYDGKSWDKFEQKNGPTLMNVFSITIAPDGAIWFGTESGISRYKPANNS
jgi:ligand-binding sensor domain-containing protein